MNIKLKLTIAAIMITLMFVACGGDDDTTKPTTNNNPFPFLKVGNEWTYELDNNPNDTVKYKIVSINSNILKIDCNYKNSIFTEYWYANANHWKKSILESGDGGFILLHRNYYVGQKWDINYSGMKTGEVISVSETVTVPAGTFANCIKVQIAIFDNWSGDYYYNYWIDKNIGIILSEEGSLIEKLKSKNF